MIRTTIDRPGQDTEFPPAVRTCRCGQQLDVCAREHCPRCGCTIGSTDTTQHLGTWLDRRYVA